MPALIWITVTLGGFYALVIRPQRQQLVAHRELLASLSEGDEVITAGGMFGRIETLQEDIVALEVSPGTSVRVARAAITRKVG